MEQQSGLEEKKKQGTSAFYRGQKEIILRTLTALVGAPLLIAAIIYGTPFSDILFMVIGAAGLYEWSVIAGNSRRTLFFWWAGLCLVPIIFIFPVNVLDDPGAFFLRSLVFFALLLPAVFLHQFIKAKSTSESLRVTFGVFLIVQMVTNSLFWGRGKLWFLPFLIPVLIWVVKISVDGLGRLAGESILGTWIHADKERFSFIARTFFSWILGVLLALYFYYFEVLPYCAQTPPDTNYEIVYPYDYVHDFFYTVCFLYVVVFFAATCVAIGQFGDALLIKAKCYFGGGESGNLGGGVLNKFSAYGLLILCCPLPFLVAFVAFITFFVFSMPFLVVLGYFFRVVS